MRRFLLWGLLLTVVTVGMSAALVVVNLEPLVNDYRWQAARVVGDKLGRQVEFGPVRLTWKHGLGMEFTSVQLQGAVDGDKPQLTVKSAFLRLDAWKMVRSRGRRLMVQEAVLTAPVVRLTRDEDGRWDFQDMLDHLQQDASEQVPTSTQDANRRLQELEIAGVRLSTGRVEIEDRMLHRHLVVDGLDLAVSAMVPGRDVSAEMNLTLDDGRNRAPLSFSITLRPLPARLDFSALPAMDLRVTLKDLELGTWASLLDANLVKPAEGRLSVNLKSRSGQGGRTATLEGYLALNGLVLAQASARGARTDLRAEIEVDVDLDAPLVQVQRLMVSGPSLGISTRLMVVDRTLAGIKDAEVDLRVDDLSTVLSWIPQGSTMLPQDLRVSGPFLAQMKGNPERARLTLNLDRARLTYGDLLDKASGIPLQLNVTAGTQGTGVVLNPVELAVAQARVAGTVVVPGGPMDPWQASLKTGEVTLAQIKSLVPLAAKQERGDLKWNGTVHVEAQGKVHGNNVTLQSRVQLKDADVVLPRMKLKGGADVVLSAVPTDNHAVQVDAVADASALEMRRWDDAGHLVVDKPRKMPVRVQVSLLKDLDRVQLTRGRVNLGRTTVLLNGSAEGLAPGQRPVLDAGVEQLDLALDDVRTLYAPARLIPPGSRLRAQVRVRGNPLERNTLVVSVDDLGLTVGRSHVEGQATLTNMQDPELDVELPVVDVDLRDVRTLSGVTSLPRTGRVKSAVTLTGHPQDPQSMVLTVQDLSTRLWGGTITGSLHVQGFTQPQADLQLSVDKLVVDTVLKEMGERGNAGAAHRGAENATHGLPAETRARLKELNGSVELGFGELRHGRYVGRDVVLVLRIRNGVVACERLDLGMWGGAISAMGTEVDPTGEWLVSHLVLHVRELDLAQVYDAHSTERGRLSGTMDLDLDLRARGMTRQDIMQSLEGPVSVSAPEMVIRGTNFLEALMKPLKEVPLGPSPLDLAPVPVARADINAPNTVEAFHAEGRFEAGRLVLTRPMSATTVFGSVQLEGAAHMDSRLALVGTTSLHPQIVGQMTRGHLSAPQAVLVPVKIGGTWNDPRLDGVDLGAFVRALGLPGLVGEAGQAAERAGREIAAQAAHAREEADRLRQQTMAEARQRAERAAAGAREKAEMARKAAADAASMPAEQLKRSADLARNEAEQAQRMADRAREQADALVRQQMEDVRDRTEKRAQARMDAFRANASGVKDRLDAARDRMGADARGKLEGAQQGVESLHQQLAGTARERLSGARQDLDAAQRKARDAAQERLEQGRALAEDARTRTKERARGAVESARDQATAARDRAKSVFDRMLGKSTAASAVPASSSTAQSSSGPPP